MPDIPTCTDDEFTQKVTTAMDHDHTTHRAANQYADCPTCGGQTETNARLRRIETRVTQTLIGLGLDDSLANTTYQRSELDAPTSTIHLGSGRHTLRDIMNMIPRGWNKPVRVLDRNDVYLCTLDPSGS